MNKTISDIAAAVSWIRNYHNRNINITEGLARIVLNLRVNSSILSANTGEIASLIFLVYYNSMTKTCLIMNFHGRIVDTIIIGTIIGTIIITCEFKRIEIHRNVYKSIAQRGSCPVL